VQAQGGEFLPVRSRTAAFEQAGMLGGKTPNQFETKGLLT